jgi:hypothetical protein
MPLVFSRLVLAALGQQAQVASVAADGGHGGLVPLLNRKTIRLPLGE